MTYEAHQRVGRQSTVTSQWGRRTVRLWGAVLLGLLLLSSVSSCGRKGPPTPLRQQAPSAHNP